MNTFASYLRIVANGIVSIIVTRIALNALGVDDYGLYNLMAGTIALLSFVNTALLISSQRYFSIAIGSKNNSLLQRYFSGSILIHLMFSIIILVILLSIQPILFGHVLNIKPEQTYNAKMVYQIMVLSTCITMNSVPFAAMMNAYEDIAALSYINIGSYVIQLCAALSLLVFKNNLLIIFSIITLLSIICKLFGEIIWCKIRYKILNFSIRRYYDRRICKEMVGFSGWNTLGSFSVLIRDQGVAVMLNFFFGTAINAAYGIANQVNSLVLSFASNLTAVFAPSIIQAKGAGDEQRMRFLAIVASKISFMLSAMMALPILLFLHPILSIWLGDVPDYTESFCRLIIICFMLQMLYSGINRMIYATGKIRNYQIGIFVVFTSILPLGVLIFSKFHQSPPSILLVMILSQITVLIISLYSAYKNCGLVMKNFFFRGIIAPIFIFGVLLYIGNNVFDTIAVSPNILYIILSSLVIDCIFICVYYFLVFDNSEKNILKNLISTIKRK